MRGVRILAVALSAILLTAGLAPAAELSSSVGQSIDDFTLKDFRGKAHSLSDFKGQPVVVIFMGTECPLAKLYGPRMQQLSEEFDGAAFLGVNSNRQDSVTELDAHARNHGIKFPLLKDLGNKVADAFGATRTPQVYLLDKDHVVRYQGRIDGQYTFGAGVGYSQPKLNRRDLAEALTEVMAGKEVSVAVTEAKGCIIGRVRDVDEDAKVTYSNQMARLFNQRCVECHREGQIAPFAMTNYDEVAGWGEMIAEVVREQRMPPWHADPAHGKFSNENTLTQDEKEMVFAWVDAGCPEGDRADLPEAPVFTEGWTLPREPDQIVYIGDEAVDIKAEGVEDYRYYNVDPGFTEDKWVRIAECMPGNPGVVHHIIVFVSPPNDSRFAGREVSEEEKNLSLRERKKLARERRKKREASRSRRRSEDRDVAGFGFLAGFAPGTRPLDLGPGYAKKVPAGSKLVFQMHYTPNGSPQKDRSSIGLIFEDPKKVTHQLSTTNASYHALEIPPHESNYVVEARKTFRRDTTMVSLFPHMHVRGKSFKYEVTYPDGKQEVLLDVPQYDFNWQNSFILAEPKTFPAGTEMLCTAVFDNSEENLYNPNPDETVRWGDQTWEEMMIGWYDVAFPVEQIDQLLEQAKEAQEAAEKEISSSDSGE